MHRLRVLLGLMAAVLCPRLAIAGTPGIDLAWGTCDITPSTTNLDFACDTNDLGAPFRLAMTFRNGVDVPDFAGVSMVVDFCTGPNMLPNWWMLGSGQCRSGSFVFPAYTSSLGSTCDDLWAGLTTSGGYTFTAGFGGNWNSARIVMDFATADPVHIVAGTRYVAGAATLDQRHTVDDGSGDPVCTGCTMPACFVLNSVEVFGFTSSEDYLIEAQDQQQYVMWQGGAVGDPGCPFIVAARPSTWGSVKAMYR